MPETVRIPVYGVSPSCSYRERIRKKATNTSVELQEKYPINPSQDLGNIVHYESSEEEEDSQSCEAKRLLRTSFNWADYIQSRESNIHEIRKTDRRFGFHHIINYDAMKEFNIQASHYNKILSSKWLTYKHVAFGTKDNKFMVYNVITKKLEQITPLVGKTVLGPNDQHGVNTIDVNPSRTMVATLGLNNSDLAVYKLPSLSPVGCGVGGHESSIYALNWIDDEHIVTGSDDTRVTLWRVSENMFDDPVADVFDKENLYHRRCFIPLAVKRSKSFESVRCMVYNKFRKEIVVYTGNAFFHVWNIESFKQRLSIRISRRQTNHCLAYHDGLYAAGGNARVLLLDQRTFQSIKRVSTRRMGTEIRSVTFQDSNLTFGTDRGTVMFYDIRAHKYIGSKMESKKKTILSSSEGFVLPDEHYMDNNRNGKYSPAISTLSFDHSGTRLFCGGGPDTKSTYGNYASIWQ